MEQKTAVDYTFPITVKEVVSLGLYPQLSLFQRITAKDWQKVAAALSLSKWLTLLNGRSANYLAVSSKEY
ncbi:hypothetical protein OM428_05900 [Enterococcus gallinarum]|nr:hypothetical protein [Enterococcus gallinarum]